MPVVVKTPVCPVVVSPPPVGVAGAWRETGDGRNVRALFVNEANQPVGFALTGERVAEREALSQQMPDIMSLDEPPTLDTAIRDET
jgi:rubredoxin-NAD+ reductase